MRVNLQGPFEIHVAAFRAAAVRAPLACHDVKKAATDAAKPVKQKLLVGNADRHALRVLGSGGFAAGLASRNNYRHFFPEEFRRPSVG